MKATETIYIIQTRTHPSQNSEDNWFDLRLGGIERFEHLDQAIEARDIENDKWKSVHALPQFRLIKETTEREPI